MAIVAYPWGKAILLRNIRFCKQNLEGNRWLGFLNLVMWWPAEVAPGGTKGNFASSSMHPPKK